MTRVKIDDLLHERLRGMETRPEMWAGTREAFGLQLLLLAEMLLWDQGIAAATLTPVLKRLLMPRLFGPGPVVSTTELLDASWAKKAVAITRSVVKEIVAPARNPVPTYYGLLRVRADGARHLTPLSYSVGDLASFEQATCVDGEHTIAFCALHASSLEEARSQLKGELGWFEHLLAGAVPEAWFSSEDPA